LLDTIGGCSGEPLALIEEGKAAYAAQAEPSD
jgi:hypothetical protein